ncbi:hypothetical protein DJ013_04825 [Arcticibacterium luteifluviistationis]|uniref:Uncharacterized protein n=1 Tax=Arcticibacterium luteifluviistationis TaxID=1784714 RepID=A0A2Z4G9B7_9BACT|nr:hypothetical protein DJ013_04825 [Arcticibacterium luteifluviistationis]
MKFIKYLIFLLSINILEIVLIYLIPIFVNWEPIILRNLLPVYLIRSVLTHAGILNLVVIVFIYILTSELKNCKWITLVILSTISRVGLFLMFLKRIELNHNNIVFLIVYTIIGLFIGHFFYYTLKKEK